MSATIIVFGLSGVGKSYLIRRSIDGQDGVLHLQASSLLKAAQERESGAVVDAELLRNGKVNDNQALLLREFWVVRQADSRTIVFDGHNLIDTPTGLLEIPFDVISGLAPSGVVFVVDDPDTIVQRRAADTTRVRPQRTPEELREHQDRALRLARDYAGRLDAPFVEVRSGDLSAFAGAFATMSSAPFGKA